MGPQNARDMGLIPTLGAQLLIFFTPHPHDAIYVVEPPGGSIPNHTVCGRYLTSLLNVIDVPAPGTTPRGGYL